ncbi:MAG: ABC transporter permease [Synergistaceae bacterium]|nr:ABC transporter permease [Synergistaceae bacterium]
MIRYFLRRFAQMVLVLLAVSVIVFLVMSFTGDPVLMIVPPTATDAQIAEARTALGLDRPLWVQYGVFLKNLLRGDMGVSYIFKRPALTLIVDRMPATLELVFFSMIISLAVALPCGVYAGAKPGSPLSRAVMGGSLLGISLPSFWVGILLIFYFAVEKRLLPSSGRGATATLFGIPFAFLTADGFRHIILPACSLALGTLAMLIRLIRAQIMEVMRQDFIKFARAKGVSRGRLLFSHALKNALVPVVTVFGMQIGGLIAFATVTETIFAWPGMGKLLVDSINTADRSVIVAYLMIVAVIFVLINFIVDVVYTLIDPRIDLR